MVKSGSRRGKKYEAKIDGSVIGGRYEATKDLAVRSQRKYFADAVELENKVKVIVDGEPSILHHFYIAYAEEIVKKKTEEEWQIAYNKWEARGLRAQLLNNLSVLLTGWRAIIPPPPNVCLFDVGRFDVNVFG